MSKEIMRKVRKHESDEAQTQTHRHKMPTDTKNRGMLEGWKPPLLGNRHRIAHV